MAWRSSDVSSGGDRSSKGPLRLGACVVVAVLGAGLIGPGGCSLEVSGLHSSPQKACSFAVDCDDGDPCTVDVCDKNLCSHQDDAVPDDANECTVDSCVGGKPLHDAMAAKGKACGSGGALVCDGKGQCAGCTMDSECMSAGVNPSCDVAQHLCVTCSDGSKNGDETSVDCGGSHCGKCQGEPCSGGGCANKLTCVDGVCCGTPCDGPCEACNLIPGVCSPLAQGAADPPTCQSPMQSCDGKGACKASIGQPCTSGDDCANGACRAGICRRLNGEGCGESEECQSNRCDKGTCAACVKGFDCPSLACDSGLCQGGIGEPCGADSECALSACKGGLCRNGNGTPCTGSDQCESEHCAGVCLSCNPMGNDCGSAQCAMVNGVSSCLLSKGDFCASDAECDSGKCTGFPAKCL